MQDSYLMLKVPFSADMGRSDYRDGSAYFSSNGHVIHYVLETGGEDMIYAFISST
jgi:hypothetical protein